MAGRTAIHSLCRCACTTSPSLSCAGRSISPRLDIQRSSMGCPGSTRSSVGSKSDGAPRPTSTRRSRTSAPSRARLAAALSAMTGSLARASWISFLQSRRKSDEAGLKRPWLARYLKLGSSSGTSRRFGDISAIVRLVVPARLALALSLLCGVILSAADSPADGILSGYSFTSWNEGAGRPLGSVYAIAQTDDGYLWIGADAGLLRFDGWRFFVWDGLSDTPVRGSSQDTCGRKERWALGRDRWTRQASGEFTTENSSATTPASRDSRRSPLSLKTARAPPGRSSIGICIAGTRTDGTG